MRGAIKTRLPNPCTKLPIRFRLRTTKQNRRNGPHQSDLESRSEVAVSPIAQLLYTPLTCFPSLRRNLPPLVSALRSRTPTKPCITTTIVTNHRIQVWQRIPSLIPLNPSQIAIKECTGYRKPNLDPNSDNLTNQHTQPPTLVFLLKKVFLLLHQVQVAKNENSNMYHWPKLSGRSKCQFTHLLFHHHQTMESILKPLRASRNQVPKWMLPNHLEAPNMLSLYLVHVGFVYSSMENTCCSQECHTTADHCFVPNLQPHRTRLRSAVATTSFCSTTTKITRG